MVEATTVDWGDGDGRADRNGRVGVDAVANVVLYSKVEAVM